MITNKSTSPLRQRRSAVRTTAIALCLGLTAIGYGVARMAEPPSSSSYGALPSAAEGWAMNPRTGPPAADDSSRSPSDASCSGGSEGGADATGNQCNDSNRQWKGTLEQLSVNNDPEAIMITNESSRATNAAATAAACSGGAEGGMDATGNQCNP